MSQSAPESQVIRRFALLALTLLTALFYFQWRIGAINPAHPIYSWVVYAAELAGFARALLFMRAAGGPQQPRNIPPAPAGLGVDVFIPTCGEPLDVVRRTALAAHAIRYPHATWLLDDAQRPEMRELAAELGCSYVARTEHNDAKTGNLNHALALANGEFVAILDADHVAAPQLLDRTLGHFGDERVAFVQVPVETFNTGSFDHIRPRSGSPVGASFFHRVVQRGRDASNTTLFTGSGAILRRRALDAIGGFATGTVSEDVHTSFRLHAAGWRSVSHPEVLVAGMGPVDAAGYCSQHLRWSQDAMQFLWCENIFAPSALTPAQRMVYATHVLSNLEAWRHLFVYALPIVILLTGILPVQTDVATFLAHFIPYGLNVTLAPAILARGYLRVDETAVYNLARCPVSIRGVFTARRRRWKVTPKARGEQRLVPEMLFARTLLLLTMGAIAYACVQASTGRSPLTGSALAIVVVWAGYHVLTATRLLLLEQRCARERRSTTRFDETFGATLSPAGERNAPISVDVVSASADGFTIRPRCGAARLEAGRHEGVLDAGGASVPFILDVGDSGRGGAVQWLQASARDAFDALLHQRAIERFAAADRI